MFMSSFFCHGSTRMNADKTAVNGQTAVPNLYAVHFHLRSSASIRGKTPQFSLYLYFLLPARIARGGVGHQALHLREIVYADGIDHPLAAPVAGFGLLEIPAGDRIVDAGAPVHRRRSYAKRLPQGRAQALAAC